MKSATPFPSPITEGFATQNWQTPNIDRPASSFAKWTPALSSPACVSNGVSWQSAALSSEPFSCAISMQRPPVSVPWMTSEARFFPKNEMPSRAA